MSSAAQLAGKKRKAFSPIENSYLKELYLNAAEEYASDGLAIQSFTLLRPLKTTR